MIRSFPRLRLPRSSMSAMRDPRQALVYQQGDNWQVGYIVLTGQANGVGQDVFQNYGRLRGRGQGHHGPQQSPYGLDKGPLLN